MKGVVLLGEGELEVKEFDDPTPGPGEVVVRTKVAGICGSDIHIFHMPKKWHQKRPETISGHEPAGIVESVGDGVTRVKPGDRVTIYHYIGCGKCKHCLAGLRQWCKETKGLGVGAHGGNADFLKVKEDNCRLLPDELSFIDGAFMACGAGTSFSALSKLQPSGTDTLAVIGLGPVGLTGIAMAKAMGARVIGIGRRKIRQDLAAELGADHVIDSDDPEAPKLVKSLVGAGVDLVYETSGAPEAHKVMCQILRRGGRACLVAGRGPEPSISASSLIGKQLTLYGSFVLPIWMVEDMTRFMVNHDLNLEKAVTHRFPIDKAAEAFELFESGECGKAVFEW